MVASVLAEQELKQTIAAACRILAAREMVDGVLGHVSARLGGTDMLIRCRGPRERGVGFTKTADIRHVRDGKGHRRRRLGRAEGAAPAQPAVRPPSRCRSGRACHPSSALLCGLAGLDTRPVFGAFNIPAMRLALAGIPTYPRSVLITRDELGDELAAAMGDSTVCVLAVTASRSPARPWPPLWRPQ